MSNNETLAALWNNNDAALIGLGDDYAETIDRDQAVDEDGKGGLQVLPFRDRQRL